MTQFQTAQQTQPAAESQERAADFERLLRQEMKVGEKGIEVKSLDDLLNFAKYIWYSGLAPDSLTKNEEPKRAQARIAIAIQSGLEIGLPPMVAMKFIAVVNNRACLWGDALPALAQASGVLVEFHEYFERNGKPVDAEAAAGPIGDDWVAVCRTRRNDMPHSKESRFSVADAKAAGLWSKPGPWKQYPKRMLLMRARAFNFRDNLADVLCGLHVHEEVADYAIKAPEMASLSSLPSGRQTFAPGNARGAEPVAGAVTEGQAGTEAGTPGTPANSAADEDQARAAQEKIEARRREVAAQGEQQGEQQPDEPANDLGEELQRQADAATTLPEDALGQKGREVFGQLIDKATKTIAGEKGIEPEEVDAGVARSRVVERLGTEGVTVADLDTSEGLIKAKGLKKQL